MVNFAVSLCSILLRFCPNELQPSCPNGELRMLQVLDFIGAGEGNRTLLFSLEGCRRLNTVNAHSDKTPPKATIEPQRKFRCVRRTAAS
jgi:hypothetical protein